MTRVNLRTLDVGPFEYDQPLERDDFVNIVQVMLAHNTILFATPVYWYAMSGRLKTLFDRLNDLVTVRKDLGRRLKGRYIYVVACGSETELPDGFEVPFRDTAAYLDMHYGGIFYAQTNSHGLLPAAYREAEAFGNGVVSAELDRDEPETLTDQITKERT